MNESASSGQLSEEFVLLASHIERIADAFMHTVRSPISADSQAALDREDTTSDDAEGWGRPLFEYSHRLAPLSAQAFDHMHATAALVLADRVVQAPVTVMRTALEALSMISWLYEPGIDQEEKVRRHVNLRLVRSADGLNEYLAVGVESSDVPKPAGPERILEGVQRSKHLIRATWTRPNYNKRADFWKPGYLGSPVPTVMSRLRMMRLLDPNKEDVLGAYLYRQMSAVAHAGELGLAPYLTPRESAGGTTVSTIGVGASMLVIQTSPLLLAVNTTVQRLAAYYGFDLSPWTRQWTDSALHWKSRLK